MENTKQTSQKKIWLNITVVLVILLLLMTIVGSLNDFEQILVTIGQVNIGFLVLALLMAFTSFLLMSLSTNIVLRALNKNISYGTGFLIQTVEPFFNGITPFSTGAQPFQVYYYHKFNVPANEATSVLVVNFILFQLVTVLLSSLGFIIFFNQILSVLGNMMIYVIIGYSINTVILVGLFLLAYIPTVHILFEKLLSLFEKIKWTKKLATKLKAKAFNFVGQFQSGVHFLFKKKRVFILSSLTKLISIILLYSTTILIVMSLGLSTNTPDGIYMIVSGLLAVTTMMFVPLPGASGGTEVAYTLLLGQMINSVELVTIMLLWRLITYYFGMLYGFIGYILLQNKKVKS